MSDNGAAYRPGKGTKDTVCDGARRMVCEFIEDVCGGASQELAPAALGEFARRGRDEDEPMGLDGSLASGATQVGQSHHAAHRMSGKREAACHAEGHEQVGEVGSETVDV